jgi:hypothetical protein
VSWSKIPIALRIAALVMIVVGLFGIIDRWVTSFEYSEEWFLCRTAVAFALKAFGIYGALELVGLMRARAALGARLAAAGWVALIVLSIADVVMRMNETWFASAHVAINWLWWASMLAIGAGLVIAALRRPAIAIAGGVVWLAIVRPPVVDASLWRLVDYQLETRLLIIAIQLVVQAAVILVLASVAVGDVPDGFAIRDPKRIHWGLTRIENALWLRLIAVALVPILTIVLVGERDHGISVVGYAMIGAGFVNVVALLCFGLGALDAARSNHPDLRRTPFYVAATGALWCAGVTLHQVPELYRVMFGDHTSYFGDRAEAIAGAFGLVVPLVALAAIVAWTVGVGGFAIRRERLDLSERAQRTAILFVVLSAANLVVLHWLLPEARSDGSAVLVLLVALVCNMAALTSAARLAGDAAELGNVDQHTIPTATMVSA